jgi:D-beta-D-heptose 7-phosphate kinase/D-beta-D-heptose 1-phosphate adenosyltransferase
MLAQLPDFSKTRVLVIGDVMLDRYWHGSVSRISPEAPVPVVKVGQNNHIPGGAANVAINVAALGANVTLLGLVGSDEPAAMLAQLLHQAHVQFQFAPTALPTITKLRILSQHQQLIRLDFEEPYPLECLPDLHALYAEQIKHADIVIFSDYGKGALAQAEPLIALAEQLQIPVFVDPKVDDITHYRGATLVTPNLKEFQQFVGPAKTDEAIVSKGTVLLNASGIQHLLITRGEDGMTLLSQGSPAVHLHTQAREVFDVTGAGDTVMAVLATAYASGCDLPEAARIANIAAGIVVGKLGTASVSRAELLAAVAQDERMKIFNPDEVRMLVEASKARGERVVMTNGCFDILHAGHVQYLRQAKSLGDRLIVAVNSDDSVRRLKGETRPLNSLDNRMQVLAGLESIDWVVFFEEDTPGALIESIMPDILVKAGDYQVHQIAGHEAVLAAGGRVEIMDFKSGCSTTGLVNKIMSNTEVSS